MAYAATIISSSDYDIEQLQIELRSLQHDMKRLFRLTTKLWMKVENLQIDKSRSERIICEAPTKSGGNCRNRYDTCIYRTRGLHR